MDMMGWHGHRPMVAWEYGSGSTRMIIHTRGCKELGRHGSKVIKDNGFAW